MTECQGCGAWNDSSRTLCVLCGTPLAETDEWDATADLPPLPPLPDGGLSASMPAWLRERPAVAADPLPASTVAPVPLPEIPAGVAVSLAGLAPLGASADPRTFLTDDDFPLWLRELAAREPVSPSSSRTAAAPVAPRPHDRGSGTARPEPVGTPPPSSADTPSPAASPTPPPDTRPPAALVAARAREEHRARAPWETLLLVILFIGVVVAALWALVSNGVFSPGL